MLILIIASIPLCSILGFLQLWHWNDLDASGMLFKLIKQAAEGGEK